MSNAPAALPPAIGQSPSLFSHFVLGVTPHETQAQFLECRAPVKVAACGRRWGKSTAAALDVIHLAVTQPGSKQLCAAPTSDQTSIVAGEVQRLLLGGPLAPLVAEATHSPFIEVTLTNGSTIMARSAGDNGKNLRGRAADRVVVDEAAFVPEAVVQEVILPMLADTAGQLVLISTPFGRNTFWEFFVRGQSGDPTAQSFQLPSHLNPHISAAFIEAQRLTMTEAQFRTEWGAEFLDDLGTVFAWPLIEQAITGELQPQPAHGHRYALGWDPAKYHDRSAVIVLDVTFQPFHVVACEQLEGRDYGRQLAQVVTLSRHYNGAYVVMDCTGNDALLEQLVASGVPCEGVKFTNAAKQQLIDNLVLVLEQRALTFPHLPALIQEMRYYAYSLTQAGNVKLGAPERAGAYDDLTTALALAVKSQMQPPETQEVVSFWDMWTQEDQAGYDQFIREWRRGGGLNEYFGGAGGGYGGLTDPRY